MHEPGVNRQKPGEIDRNRKQQETLTILSQLAYRESSHLLSAKMSPTQCNRPVHEQELLAGVEMMLRHHDILQGPK